MTSFLTLVLLSVAAQSTTPATHATHQSQDAIGIQVALDRAGFSTGVIDGRIGANTKRAMEAYRQQHQADPAPHPQPLLEYRITAADMAGPFSTDIPNDLVEQSKLPALGYRSVQEALAERFHSTVEFLQKLNPSAAFEENAAVLVPNVEPFTVPPPEPPAPKDTTPKPTGTSGRTGATDVAKSEPSRNDLPPFVVRVSKAERSVTVTDADGKIVLFAPVTTGSEHDPLPIGEWKVNGVQRNPTFKYNPDLFWDADPGHTKATVPAGPNSPVGVVWIDISKDHYGLHGTPEPSQVGRTESHGCVRLTNWDAWRLASLVKPGTRVVFAE
jgi:lipoprotein-anchoring transpeptidase ErfK/SrfK